MSRDDLGRRVFKSEKAAFKAQRSAMLNYGVCSAIIRRSDGMLVMLYDPLADDVKDTATC
jgi:hypothetical protein